MNLSRKRTFHQWFHVHRSNWEITVFTYNTFSLFYTHCQQDVAYNLTAHQFHRFSMAVPSLQRAFQDAYQRMVASENGYSGLLASIQESVNNMLSRFNLVEQMLQQFRSSLDALPSDFVLKQDAEGILLDVNTTFTNARDLAQNSVQV